MVYDMKNERCYDDTRNIVYIGWYYLNMLMMRIILILVSDFLWMNNEMKTLIHVIL